MGLQQPEKESIVGEYMEKLDGGGLMLRGGRRSVYRSSSQAVIGQFYRLYSTARTASHTVYLNFLCQPGRKMFIMNMSLTSFSRAVL